MLGHPLSCLFAYARPLRTSMLRVLRAARPPRGKRPASRRKNSLGSVSTGYSLPTRSDCPRMWLNPCDQSCAAFHRSEEHTYELQSLMRISYAAFCLNKKKNKQKTNHYKGSKRN